MKIVYLILTLPAISLSCGCAAKIAFCGFIVVDSVVVGSGRTFVGINGGAAGDEDCGFFGTTLTTTGFIVRFGGNSSRTVPGIIIGSSVNRNNKQYQMKR